MAALGSNMKGQQQKAGIVADIKKTKKSKAAKPKAASIAANPKPKTKKVTATSKKSAKSKVVKQTKKVDTKKVVATKASPVVSKKKSVKAVPKKPSATKEKKTAKAAPVKKQLKSTPQKESPVLRNAKLILEPSKRKKIRKTRVYLEGDLNINNVDAFKAQIEPIFNDYDYIDFFMRDVKSLDLCHIQMLYHFQHFPKKKGKTVTIDADLSSDIKRVVINAGFKELLFIPKLV